MSYLLSDTTLSPSISGPVYTDCQQIDDLLLDNHSLTQEWQTCEELLGKPQRDNEQKHALIESQKQYIRELEKLLDSSWGAHWKADHQIAPRTIIPTAIIHASTPLPKPSPILSHSATAALAAHRLSRFARGVSARGGSISVADTSVLKLVREIEEIGDATTNEAPKRLHKLERAKASTSQTHPEQLYSTTVSGDQSQEKLFGPSSDRSASSPSSSGTHTPKDHIAEKLDAILSAIAGLSVIRETQSEWQTELSGLEERCISRQARLGKLYLEATAMRNAQAEEVCWQLP